MLEVGRRRAQDLGIDEGMHNVDLRFAQMILFLFWREVELKQ